MTDRNYNRRGCCWVWKPSNQRPIPPPTMTPFEKAVKLNLEIKILRREQKDGQKELGNVMWRFHAVKVEANGKEETQADEKNQKLLMELPGSHDGPLDPQSAQRLLKLKNAVDDSARNLIEMWSASFPRCGEEVDEVEILTDLQLQKKMEEIETEMLVARFTQSWDSVWKQIFGE